MAEQQKQQKLDRKERRWQAQHQGKMTPLNGNMGDREFRTFATRYLKGEITPAEYSRTSKALRVRLARFLKQCKKITASPDFYKNLPEDAIIKTVTPGDSVQVAPDATETAEAK